MNVIGFKEAKCKNCYKCVRTCNVKAISVKNEQAQILDEKCILCGQCLEACPQNAKTFISDLERVKKYLKEGIPTVISIAPSYLGVLNYERPGQVVSALMQLGFSQVRETAEGAAYVTNEYKRILAEGKMKNIITTCCQSVNDLIEIYFPGLVEYMAPVVSPMIAHGKLLRAELGYEVKIVFLGPCISKKREAESDPRTTGYIDAVINFIELEQWLQEENIDITACGDAKWYNKNPRVNRLYPISNGIISSVLATNGQKDRYKKLYIDGINNCIELFKSMEEDQVSDCFIEANICDGGCIKGPMVNQQKVGFSRFKIKLDMEEKIKKTPVLEEEYPNNQMLPFGKKFCDRSLKEMFPTEEEIKKILKKIGKTTKEHELNCGACGYSSCREKAIAVFQGKAELNMCIPFMQEKAQSMSNVVLDTTPNIIIVVDADMKIVEFSRAAEIYFHKTRTEAKEMYLFEIIDHLDFEYVLNTRSSIMGKKVIYENIGLATLQDIVYIKEQNSVLGIFQDITLEEEKEKQNYKIRVETIEMAQKVIDKQMMVAQEIAGLLGETTAETKVTLTKLRDTIMNDGKEKKG
jgi:iron only hydrogenase large subunit-like protein/uncharacterized Fe-S cluster-containing protein